jgi:hypothetical protein
MGMSEDQGRSRVRRIDGWLADVGIPDEDTRGDIAVDLADILAASQRVQELLEDLIVGGSAMSADDALDKASEIEVQLFTELASHLDTLQKAWPVLLDHFAERVA